MHIQFPSSFLWGAALSSYQCEGGNVHADWAAWEKEKNLEPAGKACDHYRLFKEDFQLARSLNLNALRLSLEWSRLQPAETGFDERQIEHYRQVVETLISFRLEPVITLHHFTNPQWFIERGGWKDPQSVDFFLLYLEKVVESLKDKVRFWLVFNEPLVYIYNGFIEGIWPPGETSLTNARRAMEHITAAYERGYDRIKHIYQRHSLKAEVSLAKHVRIFSACPKSFVLLNKLSAFYRSRIFNFQLLEHLHKKGKLDFLAINYYCKEYSKFKGVVGAACSHQFHPERKNYLNWHIDPSGLCRLLLRLKKFKLPVYITENGTAEHQAYLYNDFLLAHLKSMAQAFAKGVDIRGYFWWSLLDNFEWDKGFKPRFGLIEVDYNTFRRSKKPFALLYADICRDSKIQMNNADNGF